jgi:hypothetical protein
MDIGKVRVANVTKLELVKHIGCQGIVGNIYF